ncbi:MAG: glycosyltransferase [Ignavibacteriae bacterium]|nr:glycosyltransferase [Ignavibacteriota bacterium]
MIYDIFQILLWVTAIMLVISGLDDMYMDLLYWIYRKKYKDKMPDFNEMFDKDEKPIAIILGAWKESSVIGRTLSYAVRNLKYNNYRFFVGVYPNDPDTIRIVKEISKKDSRVIACINPQNGPTTKADNLNSLYAGLCEYEKVYGEFEIVLVHDAEDFMHPYALKLYNFLIGYKGYHGVQIPVIPIKSKLGGIFHRTYCDAFAEVHTKDMIVREAMDTFIPFSGTGMGFHRKAIYYLEKNNGLQEGKEVHIDAELTNTYFQNNEEAVKDDILVNDTSYKDDPFESLNAKSYIPPRETPNQIRNYTTVFLSFVLMFVSFLVYTGATESSEQEVIADNKDGNVIENIVNKVSYTDAFANTMANENLNLPENVIRISNSFRDNQYNVNYIVKDGMYNIEESNWNNDEAARNRLSEVQSILGYEKTKGLIIKSTGEDGNIYKVIIGEYGSIDEAREQVSKIKEITEK